MIRALWLLPAFGLFATLVACGVSGEKAVPAIASTQGAVVEVRAKDLSFSVQDIRLEPGKAFSVKFINEDTRTHNLHIYKRKNGDSIAVTSPERVEPGQSGVLTATIRERGEYYFQCDIHPSLIAGRVLVGVAAAAPGGASPARDQGGAPGY